MFAATRARDQLARLLLLAGVVGAVVAGIGGIDTAADRMLSAGTAQVLDDAEPDAQTVRVQALQADDAVAQDSLIRSAIDAAFPAEAFVVTRQAALEQIVHTESGEDTRIRMLDDDTLRDRAELTEGAWPVTVGDIAFSAPAAERLGVEIGDSLVVGPTKAPVAVVGIWAAIDPAAAEWAGDPAVASGELEGVIGPALVTTDLLDSLPDTATLTWLIALNPPAPADIPRLQRAVDRLSDLPDTVDPRRSQSTRVEGSLDGTLQRQRTAVEATRGLIGAPMLSLAILGALVVSVVVLALSTARARDHSLRRARGASLRRLALDAGTEAGLFAAGGAAAALLVLSLVFSITLVAQVTALGLVVAAALLAAVLALRAALRSDRGGTSERRDAGRRTLTALLLPAGICLALAALAGSQLFATGSAVRSDGSADPLAAAAPALLLVAACALTPLLAVLLAAVAERVLRRTTGLAPILPLRQLARRMDAVAMAILCLSLAGACLAFAVLAPLAADQAERRTHLATLGADVRLITTSALTIDPAVVASWPAVTQAAEVLSTPMSIGSDTATLLAASAAALDLPTALPDTAGPLPAYLTRSLADRLGAELGTVFSARIRSINQPVTIEVRGVLDTLPGVGSAYAVAVDPHALDSRELGRAANELWVTSPDPEGIAERLRAQSTQPVRILTVDQVSVRPVTSTASIMLSAGAMIAAGLGAVGFATAMMISSRRRRDEAAVLRALGLTAPKLRAMRMGEYLGVAVYGLAAGALLGAAVAAAVLPIVLGVSG